jgi:hypothetical protein
MNPWLRLLGAAVAVVVGAMLLKVLPPIIVLALFVGGVAYVNARLKPSSSKKSKPSVADARVLGFQRSPTDPFGLVGYPLSLFSRGQDGEIVDVLWGSWRRLDVKVFEYRSVDGPSDTAPTRRFACALGPAPKEWPALSVEPEEFLTPAHERGTMRTVRLGGALDGRLDVRSDDERFARQLLDQRLQDWMLASADPWGFELNGRLVLAYRPAEGPVPTTEALEALGGFLDRIPKAARHRVQT